MNKKQKGIIEYLGIPGIISMFGLACGWLAVVLLLQNLPFIAIIFSIISFVFDCLDGYVARKMHKESEFGRQLDGSFDFFNYLVFSALLFWKYISPNLFGIIVGFLILATGAFRLIRFNIEGFVVKDNKLYYAGIVVCHILLTTVMLFLIQQFYPQVVSVIAIPVMVIVSFLQVTRIPVKKTGAYGFWLALAFALLVIFLELQIWHK
jgi:CDP-diacylglycerol--serine O-phosphatidyltransferase